MVLGWARFRRQGPGDLVWSFEPGAPQQSLFNGFGHAAIPDPRDKVMDAYLASVMAGGPTVVASITGSASEAGRRVLRAYAALRS